MSSKTFACGVIAAVATMAAARAPTCDELHAMNYEYDFETYIQVCSILDLTRLPSVLGLTWLIIGVFLICANVLCELCVISRFSGFQQELCRCRNC